MKNHEGDIIGVLQLLNATDPATAWSPPSARVRPAPRRIARFSSGDRADQPAPDPAARGAVRIADRALHQYRHRRQGEPVYGRPLQERSGAHDDLRGGRQQRAAAGPLADFRMSEKDRYEPKIAGLVHDCGKINDPSARRRQGDWCCRRSSIAFSWLPRASSGAQGRGRDRDAARKI